VLPAPAGRGGGVSAHADVFDEALAEADEGGDGDDDGDEVLASATAVRALCCRAVVLKEHAHGDEEVCDYFGVGG